MKLWIVLALTSGGSYPPVWKRINGYWYGARGCLLSCTFGVNCVGSECLFAVMYCSMTFVEVIRYRLMSLLLGGQGKATGVASVT